MSGKPSLLMRSVERAAEESGMDRLAAAVEAPVSQPLIQSNVRLPADVNAELDRYVHRLAMEGVRVNRRELIEAMITLFVDGTTMELTEGRVVERRRAAVQGLRRPT